MLVRHDALYGDARVELGCFAEGAAGPARWHRRDDAERQLESNKFAVDGPRGTLTIRDAGEPSLQIQGGREGLLEGSP